MLFCIAAAFAAPMVLTASTGGGVGFRAGSSGGPVVGRLEVFTAALDLEAGTGHFEADPASLTTGFGPRDQRMLVFALDVAANPLLQFHVHRIQRAPGGDGDGGLLTLHGTLLLHGVSAAFSVPGTLERDGEKYRLRGEVPLSLAAFGIPDPSVLLARFEPGVTITFDLTGVP